MLLVLILANGAAVAPASDVAYPLDWTHRQIRGDQVVVMLFRSVSESADSLTCGQNRYVTLFNMHFSCDMYFSIV